ncbi:cytochrome P450 [Streptomyces roseus]|uniref:cytochrome P450 n=1 Tax=Streptomyces roseus TaxID=66430 RepID=UPI0033FA3690
MFGGPVSLRQPIPGSAPPPGCPAHTTGTGQIGDYRASELRRLHELDDPLRAYEELRAQYGPVAPVLLHGDLPAWIVLGYREILEVMRNPATFSKDSRRWTAFRERKVAAESPLMPMIGWQPLCVFADGREHGRLREAVVDGLAQFNRRGMRRYVARYTQELVSTFGPLGTADLVRDYAEPLPMLVVSHLLGVRPEDGPTLVEPTLDLMRGSPTAAESNQVVTQVLQDMVARKKKEPGSDLASRLIAHESGLTEAEIVEHLRLTLIAAHQGTVNLLAHTLRLLLTDQRFRGSLSGGTMTLPDALEQVMWDTPSIGVVPGPWATRDVILGGQEIREGDMLLLCIAAGNRDPEQRPDLSQPLYGNRSHLALGSGPHECPGGDIGRAIADTGIEELTALLPDINLTIPGEAVPITAGWLASRPASLPVHFTPRPAATSATQASAQASPAPHSTDQADQSSPQQGRPWSRMRSAFTKS